MQKPRVRSETVDAIIKRCYASLAKKHFEIALSSVNNGETSPGRDSNARMVLVEEYLEKAGAKAARWSF